MERSWRLHSPSGNGTKREVRTYKKTMEWKENRLATLFFNVFSNPGLVQRWVSCLNMVIIDRFYIALFWSGLQQTDGSRPAQTRVSCFDNYCHFWSLLHSVVLILSPANSLWFTRACWVIYFSVSIIIIIIIIIDRFYIALYILRSRADSLRSHVILHEWIAFYSAFLNIHRSGVLTALAWLVTHETAAISARSVYAIQPCTMSLHAKPHT